MARAVPVGAAPELAGAEQIDDSARDRRRWVDEVDRPGRKPAQSVDQERVVGAGKHDGVGPPAIVAKARAISSHSTASLTGCAAMSSSA